MNPKRLWWGFGLVVTFSFAVLLYYGWEIYQQAPPIPERVTTESGTFLTSTNIQTGQNVWMSLGGHEMGSIWGHGSYVAPDWGADYLHREAVFILEKLAQEEYDRPADSLSEEQLAPLKVRVKKIMRTNRYDPDSGTLKVPELRKAAFDSVSEHYRKLFSGDPELQELREDYAMQPVPLHDREKIDDLISFFFWISWTQSTERPGQSITYTNNWPPEELVGNKPTPNLLLWTGFSVILLIAGIGALSAYYASQREEEHYPPVKDPLKGMAHSPSMKATYKYFLVVALLFLLQIAMGVLTAHYGVEGSGLFGIPLAEILPYSITRTWHIQLAIFWIATSWLATGLFIAPAVSDGDPPAQRLGVNILFVALVIVVGGSLAGEWLSIMQKMDLSTSFWFGHQGYEYVDLGRFWQILLLVGLVLWLVLMIRAIIPAFKKEQEQKHILAMFLISSIAIAAFYAAGLMWDERTNLAIAEYWRWWVVHLWVEGFFEVFATAVIGYLFVRMGLIQVSLATKTVLASTIIFLTGGILGTFHHLYFTGTPTPVMALGATFSALEVVPLTLMGFDAFHNLRMSKSTDWMIAYRWPIYSFVAVAFWNLVGAGIFGFLINPPIALYYMQGLNTTPVHGHTALFGVYGMLGIGLMLFVLRAMDPEREWNNKLIAFGFWSINIGLGLMVLISVLPVGFLQTLASVEHGLWYARSAEFLQQDHMQVLRWMRVPGDVLFGLGAVAISIFVIQFGLRKKTNPSKAD